jgi:hypothetical protein
MPVGDRGDYSDTGKVPASGNLTFRITTGKARQNWLVSQISVENPTAPLGAACNIRKNGNLVTPVIATGDSAAGDPPVVLLSSDVITVEFTGCTSGDMCRIYAIYEIIS